MRTRTRTKSDALITRVRTRKWNPSGSIPGYTTVQSQTTRNVLSRSESMVDQPFGHGGQFNSCTHTCAVVGFNGDLSHESVMTADFPSVISPLRVQYEGYLGWKVASTFASMASSIAGNPPNAPSLTEFASLAKSRMMPSLSDGSSILTFIHELKDFRRLGSNLLRHFSSVGSLNRRLVSLGIAGWSALGSNPWDSKPKKLSQGYLAWKFAWQPFISECRSLLQKLLSFRKKIRNFIRRQKQRQQRYYGITVPVTYNGGSFSDAQWSIPPGSSNATYFAARDFDHVGVSRRRQEFGGSTARLTACMRYSYVLPASIESMDGQISSFLDVLGVNANPAIIWDAIPFSFIVDWFVNIGGFLERIRVDNIRAVTTVSQFCVSTRAERNCVWAYRPYMIRDQLSNPIFFNEAGIVCRSTYYDRQVLQPESIGVWLQPGNGLAGDRAALTAALIHANMPQRRKPFAKGSYLGVFNGTSPATFLERMWGGQ